MARVLLVTLSCLSAMLPSVEAGFGTYYGLQMPTPYKTFFKKISITMKVPTAPRPQENFLFLWPGLDVGSPLWQPVVASYATPQPYGCGADPGQWCLWPYIFESGDDEQGKKSVLSAGDVLHMVIEYNGDNKRYTQTVTRGGNVIGKLSGGANKGLPHRFQTAVECQYNQTGTTPAHTYTNLVMTLGAADPDFKANVYKTLVHSTNSGLYTNDGGKTWKVDTINMQASVCKPNSAADENTVTPTIEEA